MATADHDRITRSITLLRVFVVASALVLGCGALVLGATVTKTVRRQALDDARLSVTQYADSVVGRYVVRGDRLVVPHEALAILRRDVASRPDILSVKVWRRDGVLAWTNLAPQRIGKRFPLEDELGETIEQGASVASLAPLEEAGEDAVEARLHSGDVLEIYAPIHGAGDHVLGAYEIYANPATVHAAISSGRRAIWIAVVAVFLALYLTLLLLVRGASKVMRAQADGLRARSRELSESYEELEHSVLEAIETLNATVEARDPYTGGHSQRVRTIALAVGAELGLDETQLAALGHAALLHDVGKVAVPDAILTKPGRLTSEEFEAIKRHPGLGAELVGRLRRLRPLVPAVRHHHERWDGAGYPDSVAGNAIPLAAAVIGLADAWDAMTTDRPYRDALDVADAFREVVEGRGSQFSPAVVDAFARALAAKPEAFGVHEPVPAVLRA